MTSLNRTILLLVCALCSLQSIRAGERWWVYFTDKPAAQDASLSSIPVSARSLARRARTLPPDKRIDWYDISVYPSYIRGLQDAGATIHVRSRFLNAVSVDADAATLDALRALPFVKDLQPVRIARKRPESLSTVPHAPLRKRQSTSRLDYGPSRSHHESLNSIPLHELGVIGRGVLVGMVDDGFNSYRSHAALQPISVLAVYDFIQRDTTVSILPGESPSQGFHGAATLSVLAGYDGGNLIGPAYGATLALAKTEVGGSETIVEEDYYVEGLEWLDSLGVDIISSSLGYIDWYTQSQLDGQTAITTKVARTLASKGILLITAMGNEGNYRSDRITTGTLIAPADADSILGVGAVSPGGMLTSFSSTGPTADGRIKPDVVSQGSVVYVANWTTTNGYYTSQGTSFSTPLTSAAAALVLSAHPDATAMEIRAALKNTAVKFDDGTQRTLGYPNNYYGWGRVDAYAAALSLGPVVSNIPIVRYAVIGSQPSLLVTVRAASSSQIDLTRFAIYARRTTDVTFTRYAFAPGSESGVYTAQIPVLDAADTSYVGYMTIAQQAAAEIRRPIGTGVFELHPTPDSVSSLFPPPPSGRVPESFSLRQNFPNPFNAGTAVVFHAPRSAQVELSVYSMLGQKVRTLFSGPAHAGENSVVWPEASDQHGGALTSGLYLLRLSTPEGQYTRKMLLLK
jgi:hypothetical protein